MQTQQANLHHPQGVRRRDVLKAGLVAGVTLSTWPLAHRSESWGAAAGQPKRGGILRVWGYDPPHFDPHLTINGKTHNTVSFVYSTLVRHKVGGDVPPGTFTVEPHVAERWETPNDTTGLDHGVGHPSSLFSRPKRPSLRYIWHARTLVAIVSGRKWPMR